MTDRLLELSKNDGAKKLIRSLGLPLPLPQALRRAKGPRRERPLADDDVLVVTGDRSTVAAVLANTLAEAGANPLLLGAAEAVFVEAGQAHGRPPRALHNGDAEAVKRVQAVVLDATGIAGVADLGLLYEVFHAWTRKLQSCGRAVVIANGDTPTSADQAAARRALDGFVRSLAKELGKRGSTAQLVVVGADAGPRLPGVLRFLLGARSAFVSGQPIVIDARVQAPAATPWLRPLDGKVALVTGAARGIGKATAACLSAEGATVICLDRPQDDGPVSQVAREVGGRPLLVDVSQADAPARILEGLGERGVDIVVHNAGVTRDKTIAKMDRVLWDQALDINLGAVVRITDALLQGCLRDGGRIVCLSSVAGIAGNMGQTNYAASKAGIIGFVEHLAPEVADRGITVNAIAPGFIETRLTAAIPTMIREVGRRLSNLGQGGLPVDVAEAITFLSCPASYGVSGRVLRVCGGAFIGA
jgi:3-oxoacyl-[acyl-carrier protein] reductase